MLDLLSAENPVMRELELQLPFVYVTRMNPPPKAALVLRSEHSCAHLATKETTAVLQGCKMVARMQKVMHCQDMFIQKKLSL